MDALWMPHQTAGELPPSLPICNVKWQDSISNTEVLERCQIPGIGSMLIRAHLRWVGHVVGMEVSCTPKVELYNQLSMERPVRVDP